MKQIKAEIAINEDRTKAAAKAAAAATPAAAPPPAAAAPPTAAAPDALRAEMEGAKARCRELGDELKSTQGALARAQVEQAAAATRLEEMEAEARARASTEAAAVKEAVKEAEAAAASSEGTA
eukprot:1423689-Prymnesium_polylepis.1